MDGRKIVLATNNAGKVKEIKEMLKGLHVQVISLKELSQVPPVEEDGDTFEANARKKARIISEFCGEITLADDSGLEVDALGGLPGVKSARFAGPDAGDAENNALLLKKLEGISSPKRGARFVCALAVAVPDGRIEVIEESCPGRILFEPRGTEGFGYDPLFFHEPTGLSFAQMEPELKNKISHRGRALRKIKPLIQDILQDAEG